MIEKWGFTYRTQQHLHVDFGGNINVVQFTGAVCVDDVHKGINSCLNVSQS